MFLVISLLVAWQIDNGNDWISIFRPAVFQFWAGQNPYTDTGIYSPPWLLVLMSPLAILPASVGYGFLFTISLALCAVTIHRLGGGRWSAIAFILSPPVVWCLYLGNIDTLVIFGATLPPPLGIWLVSSKPQIGLGVMLYWLVIYRNDRRYLLLTFGPASLIFVLSLLVYGPWPLSVGELYAVPHNASLWPFSLPLGLCLMAYSIRKHRADLAVVGGPCFSPYVAFRSWAVAFIPLARYPLEMWLASMGLWVVILIQTYLR